MTILDTRLTKPGEFTLLRALIYGPPKTGKTVIAGSAPNTLLLDFDDGALTLRGQEVDVFKPEKWAEVKEVLRELVAGKHKYEVVALDTVTFMLELALRDAGLYEILAKNGDPRRAYGNAGAMVNQMLWDFRTLPVHVLYTGHLRLVEPQEGQEPINPEEGRYPLIPEVTPMVYKSLTASVDVIGRTFKKKAVVDGKPATQYLVSFEEGNRAVAGQRNMGLPPTVASLTIPKLIALAKGQKV